MSIFGKGGDWEPYEGPQGGFGWRNTENGEVLYQPDPPGGFSTEGLSDEELGVLEQVVESQGGDPSVLDGGGDTTENIELPSIEDFDEGDEIYLQRSTGGPERYTVDRVNESEVAGTKLVLEDSYGDLSSVGPEDLETRALPKGDMPDYSNVPEWVTDGTPLVLSRETPSGESREQNVQVKSIDGNIVELRGGVQEPDMLIYTDEVLVTPFDSAIHGATYHSPEHGELVFTGESDGYRQYVFEDGDGERVVVDPDESRIYEKTITDATVQKQPKFTSVNDHFGDDVGGVIEDTVQRILDSNDTAISEVYAEENLTIGSDQAVAAYNFSTAKIGFSSGSLSADRIQKYAVKMYDDGWLVANSIDHICAHEVMHSIHHHKLEGDYSKQWDDGDRVLSESVSEYAGYNPSEFVAEYGALLLLGNVDTVIEDDQREVLDEMFEKYGGMSVGEVNAI